MTTDIKEIEPEEIPSCPFCGKKVDLTDYDTIYPSGTYWRYDSEIEMRTYHSFNDRLITDIACYTMHCPTPSGGCGARISGDSEEEALAAWSRRVEK